MSLRSKSGIDIPCEYLTAAAKGSIAGHQPLYLSGYNGDIDTGAAEDVWPGGGLYPWMTGNTSLEVLSDNENDTSSGTGARTVTITGLDSSLRIVSQTISLNGTSAVSVPSQMYRINRFILATAGSGGVNAGIITVRDAGAGTTRGLIEAGYGISRQSQYTVPAGYDALVLGAFIGINRPTSVRDATVAIYIKPATSFYYMAIEITVDGNPLHTPFDVPLLLKPGYDIGFRCTHVSTNNTLLTAAWFGVLQKHNKP